MVVVGESFSQVTRDGEGVCKKQAGEHEQHRFDGDRDKSCGNNKDLSCRRRDVLPDGQGVTDGSLA